MFRITAGLTRKHTSTNSPLPMWLRITKQPRKKLMDPFTLAILGGLGVAALLTKLHTTPVAVEVLGDWDYPPEILIDPALEGWLHLVRRAVLELEQRAGVRVGKISMLRPNQLPGNGTIYLTLRDSAYQEDHAGETRLIFYEGSRSIARATVMLHGGDTANTANGAPLEEVYLVLLHELAHAMGFGHTFTPLLGRTRKGKPRLGITAEKTGHLLNSKLALAGMSMRGMAKSMRRFRKQHRGPSGWFPSGGPKLPGRHLDP